MTDEQVKRANFIETLKETAQIAKASGQEAAQGVLCVLIGAMLTDTELSLLDHVCKPIQVAASERIL